jgi:hypothetical protein
MSRQVIKDQYHEDRFPNTKVCRKDVAGWLSLSKGKSAPTHTLKSDNDFIPSSLLPLDRHCHVIHEQESDMSNDHDTILSQMRGLLITI